ncbi:MarR family transcriptional regulator [Neptunomonas sp.]|uniref:MarR family winged helix-turn-helix transcriptional regulator n=1 Tax=Neptunomonas sp. TaxID=1971898 RepID=UPI0025D00E3D|nr:MarR family transcriptional regulator [Neptunomonas sp.]
MSLQSAFIIQQSSLASKLSKKVDGSLSVHGISFTEYMILHHLSTSPLITMRRIELAECVCISASGVTRLIAPMEKIGLVEKESNPRDARQSLVKLTKAGERLYKDASVTVEHCADNALKALNDVQLEKLSALCQKLG